MAVQKYPDSAGCVNDSSEIPHGGNAWRRLASARSGRPGGMLRTSGPSARGARDRKRTSGTRDAKPQPKTQRWTWLLVGVVCRAILLAPDGTDCCVCFRASRDLPASTMMWATDRAQRKSCGTPLVRSPRNELSQGDVCGATPWWRWRASCGRSFAKLRSRTPIGDVPHFRPRSRRHVGRKRFVGQMSDVHLWSIHPGRIQRLDEK